MKPDIGVVFLSEEWGVFIQNLKNIDQRKKKYRLPQLQSNTK
jgi:hypothetical protein